MHNSVFAPTIERIERELHELRDDIGRIRMLGQNARPTIDRYNALVKRRQEILLERNGVFLEDCPYCSGPPILKHGNPSQQKQGTRIAYVQCHKCQAKTKTYMQFPYQAWRDVDDLAVRDWNSRSQGFKPIVV